MSYKIHYYDDNVIGGLTRPHIDSQEFKRLVDAMKAAGDLIQNDVADEVLVFDYGHFVVKDMGGWGMYANFDCVAHISSVKPFYRYFVHLDFYDLKENPS